MAIGYGIAQPKPEARTRTKNRKKRAEAKVKKSMREQCVERDGHCRICEWENNPDDTHAGGDGYDALPYPDEWDDPPSEWAHLVSRAKTRKMKPERRHSTAITVMLCQFHHDRLDGRAYPRIRITPLDPRLGADGVLDIDLIES